MHRESLITLPNLEPMNRGDIEVYIAKCCHDTSPSRGRFEKRETLYRGVTILVSFATDHRDRAVLAALEHTLAFATCASTVLSGADWPKSLRELLSGLEADIVMAAVFASADELVVTETVQLVFDELRV